MDDKTLKPFLRALQSEPVPPGPSEALMARIMADAARETALRRRPARTAGRGPLDLMRGLIRGLFEGLGGWPATAGLAATVVVGVWIGYSPPVDVDDWIGGADLTETYTYTSPAAILAGYDAFLADG